MKTRLFCLQFIVLVAGILFFTQSNMAAVLQVGTVGGTTSPTAGGPATNTISALTVVPANFGALHDSASGMVGGGDVSGDLYYAFTARSLDRAGDTRLPEGSTAKYPYGPSFSFAGGQLVGSTPSLSVSQAYGNYAFGYNIGVGGMGVHSDFSAPRVDIAPARVALFEVHLHFNASANDNATITMTLYDNLPLMRQPIAGDLIYTQEVKSVSSDFSFNSFQFTSGHTDTDPARWKFSNVVFAENADEASDYLLAHPFRNADTIIQVGTGGTTDPTAWSSGDPVTDAIDVSIVTNDFGGLYDGASGFIGGGTIQGDLYYSFTARSLDRAGSDLLPAGSSSGQPYYPNNAFAGGQLVGASPVLGISQAFGDYGIGYYRSAYGETKTDFSARIDMCPARVMLYDVHIRFNASANDNASIVMYTYDNLPEGQWQPNVTNTPSYTRTSSTTGDFAFNLFQFISGHKDSNSTRWLFSDVVFASTVGTATDYILDPPQPPVGTIIMIN
ncbi:MAG: hypothetical protein PF904_15405 [Kiritimatiellae bacterium]|jgi:hypothetical protein|nr:hypothetical protein [Kiritimatiellia bacterium]